jgi:protein-disulfide isomerase
MRQIQFSRRVARGLLPFSLLVAAALPGCKKAAKPTGDNGPAGSASAGAPTGPCPDYMTKICDKAGQQSQTCQALSVVMDLLPKEACTAALKNIDYSMKKIADATKVCADLTKTLCDAIGPTTQTCQMVTTQTKTFSPERCKGMMQSLPEVIGQLKKMEAANQPLSPELQKAIVEGGPAATFGPTSATVQVVEFSDFQCPYCSRAAEAVHKVKEKYGDKIRFTFRQFPLPMHSNAHVAAEAALAANAQGKFWEFHDLLFKNQQQLDSAGLAQHAKQAGLNVAAFKKSLDDHQFAAGVDADVKLGEQVQVSGTPTMFINGTRVADPTNFDAIAQVIEAALKGGARPG